jgi:hypothetical protein
VKTKTSLVIMVALLTAFSLAARAEEGRWRMPNLNPFSPKGKPPTSGRVSDAPTSGWKWPKLWPTSTASAKAKPAGPGAWQKMSAGTRTFFSKTADAINPFDDAGDDQQPVKITGSNSVLSRGSAKKKEKSRSLLPASWRGGEEKDEPRTVNDFLARPRPEFP